MVAATGKSVPDIVGPGLRVLFCGINPSLWSGAVGHHFAHPGNRFWKALQAAGFTEERLSPYEDRRLVEVGVGITNLVDGASRSAADLSRDQLQEGARRFVTKLHRWRPRAAAILGLGAYRTGFDHPRATLGLQPGPLDGTPVWVLPNPSGLQGHYPLDVLVAELRALRHTANFDDR